MDPIVTVSTLAATIALAWLLTRLAPALTRTVLSKTGGRDQALDGFRGLLATSVLVHHCILIWQQFLTRQVFPPLSHLDDFLGWGAVGFFFMASAYLFAGKVLRDKGALSLFDFAAGRVRRIVPLYTFAVVLVACITIIEAGWVVQNPPKFVENLAWWMLFDFFARPDLNGIGGSADYLGVVWTLRFEWILYAVLPILAVLYRITRSPIVVFAGLTLLAFVWPICTFFLVGAGAWYVAKSCPRRLDAAVSVAAVAGLVAVLWRYNNFVHFRPALLMTPLFVCVVTGRSALVRWMASDAMRYLGQISFSVYLLHVTVIDMLAKHWLGAARCAQLTNWQLASFALVTFVLVFWLCTGTFLAIERPFLTVGRRKAVREMLVTVPQVP